MNFIILISVPEFIQRKRSTRKFQHVLAGVPVLCSAFLPLVLHSTYWYNVHPSDNTRTDVFPGLGLYPMDVENTAKAFIKEVGFNINQTAHSWVKTRLTLQCLCYLHIPNGKTRRNHKNHNLVIMLQLPQKGKSIDM